MDSRSTRPLRKCNIYCSTDKCTALRREADPSIKIVLNGHRQAVMKKKMIIVIISEGVYALHMCHKPGCIELDPSKPEALLFNSSHKEYLDRRTCHGHGS